MTWTLAVKLRLDKYYLAAPSWTRGNGFASLCLILGSCALIGWLGYPVCELLKGHLAQALLALLYAGFWFPPYPILSLIGLWWGWRVLQVNGLWKRYLLIGFLPVLLLLPLLITTGAVLPMIMQSGFRNFSLKQRIKQAVPSPDGRHLAMVERHHTVTGWGERYFVSIDGRKRIMVGETGDFNYAVKVLWSSDSAWVVFEKGHDVLITNIPRRKTSGTMLADDYDASGKCQIVRPASYDFSRPDEVLIRFADGARDQVINFREDL